MTDSYTFVEVRNNLAELVTRAQAGEQITITRYGKPAAALGPVAEQARTVKLASGGFVTLSINSPVLNLAPDDREWVLNLIDAFIAYKAQ